MSITGNLLKLGRDHEEFTRVVELDQLHFPRPWKNEDWYSLDFSQNSLWIWKREGKIQGLALFGTPEDETAHLLKILVLPEFRGTGASGMFWGELEKELRKSGYKSVYLEVEESNVQAQSFYQRMKFLVLRRVKSYYSDGETAVMMQLTL